MPLMKSKSKKAFEHNVEAEMDAGKPQDQSLAIAYSVQRQNKRKKMAYGGEAREDGNPGLPMAKPDDRRLPEDEYMGEDWSGSDGLPARQGERRPHPPEDEYMANHFAYGGMAEDDNEPPVPGRKPNNMRPPEAEYMANRFANGGSVAEAIMNKRRGNSSPGDQVDLQENNGNEIPNQYDPYNAEAIKKEAYYHDDQLGPQPMDSNEHGDEIPSDEHDKISLIRRKMKMKRG